jgi:biopolymer transport protein ExbD
MKFRRRNNLLIESPASATGDIAFNLIVFFLVCASVQPEEGIRLTVPSSETVKKNTPNSENIEIILETDRLLVNGEVVRLEDLRQIVEAKLEDKTNDNQRVVVLKSKDPNTPGYRWVSVVSAVKLAKGIITLQIEEEVTEVVN